MKPFTRRSAECVRRAAALVGALCAVLAARSAHPAVLLAPGAKPDDPIRAGREALDHWWRYPWYDSGTDGVRRIDVKEPYSWDWLWKWTEGLDFSWLRSIGSVGNVFRWPTTILGWIAWAALAALFVTLVWLLYRWWRRRQQHPEEDEAEDAQGEDEEEEKRRVESLPYPVQRRQGDLLEEARRCYEQGNYSEAIVYLFSHQLVQMDKHHRIQLAKGKTNRQYLRELGAATLLGRLLEPTMLAFEDVFFGNRVLERKRFERCWAGLPKLESLLAEGG